MAAETRGSVYPTKTGYGIRWPENGKREFQSGFATRTEARRWFADNIAPRLRPGVASPDPSIPFDDFCDLFLERHGGAKRTKDTLRERLTSSRSKFGTWTLRELEGAADDVAAWRAGLSASSRYRKTLALRQASTRPFVGATSLATRRLRRARIRSRGARNSSPSPETR